MAPTITLAGKTFSIPPTVYKPMETEQHFRDYVRPGERVCDLGCGSGVIAVFCADVAGSVVALDISEDAVKVTRENCERHSLRNVDVRKSDMFSAADGAFDVICANPPFVDIPMKGENCQWATSVSVLDRLFHDGRRYLKEGGKIVVLYPKGKKERLLSVAEPEGFALVSTKPIGPKSAGLWLTCAIYMELLFDAHFYVFERRA